MAFTRITANVQNISALSDEPNIDDGLSAAQLKAKFDKAGVDIKAGVNNLISELEGTTAAANIGASALDAGDTSDDTVQGKLEYLQNEMQSITQGAVADGSITAAKLAANSVTSAKLDSTVTSLINGKAEITVGSYTGTGSNNTANTINLGFQPTAVMVFDPLYLWGSLSFAMGAMCITSNGVREQYSTNNYSWTGTHTLDANGFTIDRLSRTDGVSNYRASAFNANQTYVYVAIK